MVTISAKTIGVTPRDLVTELRSGKSIAQVAAEHNVNPDAVVTALVGAGDAKVNQAVADHVITATEGAKIEAKLPAIATRVVDHVFGQHMGILRAA